MPRITLDFTVEKGFRVLAAFKAHGLSPLLDPKTGQPYTELQLLKRGLVTLIAREVYMFERGQAVEAAQTVVTEAEESVAEDLEIAS